MEPLTVLLVIVLLAGAAALAGHAIARSSLPLRREMWRRRIDAIEREADERQHEDELDEVIADRLARTRRPGSASRAPEVVPNEPAAAPENASVHHEPVSEAVGHETRADEPGPRAHPEVPTHAPAPDDTVPDVLQHRRRRRLRRRRRAGLAPEDLDY